jgi:hypothetical protein
MCHRRQTANRASRRRPSRSPASRLASRHAAYSGIARDLLQRTYRQPRMERKLLPVRESMGRFRSVRLDWQRGADVVLHAMQGIGGTLPDRSVYALSGSHRHKAGDRVAGIQWMPATARRSGSCRVAIRWQSESPVIAALCALLISTKAPQLRKCRSAPWRSMAQRLPAAHMDCRATLAMTQSLWFTRRGAFVLIMLRYEPSPAIGPWA